MYRRRVAHSAHTHEFLPFIFFFSVGPSPPVSIIFSHFTLNLKALLSFFKQVALHVMMMMSKDEEIFGI